MHELKTGLNVDNILSESPFQVSTVSVRRAFGANAIDLWQDYACRQVCYLLVVSEKFLLVVQMTPMHSLNR